MVSRPSGETVDDFITDLAVAKGTGHIKSWAACRCGRVEKYNRLIRVERQLGDAAVYAGRKALVRLASV